MKVTFKKTEYNKTLKFDIDTGSSCEPIEAKVISECLEQLSESGLKKRIMREAIDDLKSLASKVRKVTK